MEPEDYGGSDQSPAMVQASTGRRERPVIPFQRRVQMQALAVELAARVMELTGPHERCLLRRMVENLVEREV